MILDAAQATDDLAARVIETGDEHVVKVQLLFRSIPSRRITRVAFNLKSPVYTQ